MEILNFEDISFVVQGAVVIGGGSDTKDVLLSIRKYFPGSKIILSTWPNQIVADLEYDDLVISNDPGDKTPHGYKPSNLNRQLVSTKSGLSCVETVYCVKTRTDIEFVSNTLFDMFKRFDGDGELSEYKFVENRMVALNTTSFNVRKKISIPFAICDFLYAGNTKDVTDLYDVELCPEEDFCFFLSNEKPRLDPFPNFVSKNSPETYIWKSFVRRRIKLGDSTLYETNNELKTLAEEILVNNVVLCNSKQLGVRSIKYKLPFVTLPYLYLHRDWLKLYNGRVSPIEVAFWDEEYLSLFKYVVREKIKGLLRFFGLMPVINKYRREL